MSLNDPQWGRKPGRGSGGNNNSGPPDLDEIWNNLGQRLNALFGRKGDKMLDEVFGEANDAVVPTIGAYEGAAGAFGFPVGASDFHVFDAAAQVHHCNYFNGDRLLPLLTRWL